MLFLVLFLFYSAYFMLRFSVDPGRRARISAVYALFGVVLIPVSFLAIRLAERLHPPGRVRPRRGRRLSGTMLRVLRRLGGMLALAGALYRNELAGKRLDASLRELREPLADASREKYVAARAVRVFVVAGGATGRGSGRLVKLAASTSRSSRRSWRLERETGELAELAREVRDDG